MQNTRYWLGFRLTNPNGAWVIKGPYYTYDEAIIVRNSLKSSDTEITAPFVADSYTEAENHVFLK